MTYRKAVKILRNLCSDLLLLEHNVVWNNKAGGPDEGRSQKNWAVKLIRWRLPRIFTFHSTSRAVKQSQLTQLDLAKIIKLPWQFLWKSISKCDCNLNKCKNGQYFLNSNGYPVVWLEMSFKVPPVDMNNMVYFQVISMLLWHPKNWYLQ